MTNIYAVSKKAGVSTATVSRAFASPEKVLEKTRKTILEAAAELNYRPNGLARGLRVKRSNVLVVLVPDISNPFFSRVIRGIETGAHERGYSILLGNTAGERERELFYSSLIASSQADGIIQLSASYPLKVETPNVPIVNACECFDAPKVSQVKLDNEAAARAVTEFLIAQGHKRIAVINGPEDSPLTRERLAGYRSAIKSAGLSFDDELQAPGDFTTKSGAFAVDALMAIKQPPSAIFCQNDEMAFGAMKRLKEIGLVIPADISVVGFDNIRFSEYSNPPLTTVSQPAEALGRRAVEILCDRMEGLVSVDERTVDILPYELIVRESTSPR